MNRAFGDRWFFVVLVLVAAMAGCKRGKRGDGLAEGLSRAKDATVLLRAGGLQGSGFVAVNRDDAQYVVTNAHVVAGAEVGEEVQVSYRPGSPRELTSAGTLMAVNTQDDLALIKVPGPRDAPEPLQGTEDVAELASVVSIGFPYGGALGLDGQRPAPTLSRAAISSLRRGALGRVEIIQLDNNLNPGNSGGPVVTDDGQVAGVAVAALKGTGISFVIPWGRVRSMLEGRAARVELRRSGDCSTSCTVDVEARAIDPFHQVSRLELRRIVADAAFLARPLKRNIGAEGKFLAIEDRPASGELKLSAEVQVERGERTFLQLGFRQGLEMVYEAPFEITADDLANAPSRPPPPRSGGEARPPQQQGASGHPPCSALEGTWTRPDGFTYVTTMSGCQLTGIGDVPQVHHVLRGTYSPESGTLRFATSRRTLQNGCETVMSGTLTMLSYDSMLIAIERTDGRCDVPAIFTENFVHRRR